MQFSVNYKITISSGFKKVMSYHNSQVINMMTTSISADTYNYRRALFVEPAAFGLSV